MSCGMEFLGSFAIKTNYTNEVSKCALLQASNPALVDDVSLATGLLKGGHVTLLFSCFVVSDSSFFVKFIIIIICV